MKDLLRIFSTHQGKDPVQKTLKKFLKLKNNDIFHLIMLI